MAPDAETLNQALALHKSGDLPQAEQYYRKILRVDPRHADALHLLGVLGQQRGEPSMAIEYIGKAIAVDNSKAAYHANLAAAHQALGRHLDAENCCRRAIRLEPRYADAHYNLGLALESQGKSDAALAAYTKATELNPAIAEAHLNRGNVLRELGRPDEAENSFRKAIEVRPGYAPAHYNLGNVLHGQNKNDDAIECYRRALSCEPNYLDARFNLATVWQACRRFDEAIAEFREVLLVRPQMVEAAYKLGLCLAAVERLEEAAQAFQQTIDLRPDDEHAHNNLGQVWQLLGRPKVAEASFHRAIEIRPDFSTAWNNLGVASHSQGQTQAAIAQLRKALDFDRGHVHANVNLGTILKNMGRLTEASECLQRVLDRDPGNSKVRVLAATLLPPIYSSVAELLECRRKFSENVKSLVAQGVSVDPEKELVPHIFYLPYQGLNDRDLQRDLARLYPVAASPPAEAPALSAKGMSSQSRASSDGSTKSQAGATINGHVDEIGNTTRKIRIGFVSHHFRAHTISQLMCGMISGVSREKFSVTVLSIGDHQDELADSIRDRPDELVVLPLDARRARQTVADLRLDVLFYADIGMDPYSYSLAFHRLAPVQCVTWGHPVTTGIPNIDYFLSSKLLEPDDADEHYTEQLVRLVGLPTCYSRPKPPPTYGRSHYGIPDDCHVYLCPQSLFKFHPDFDQVLKAILARDPNGHVVLVEGLEPEWTQTLHARFRLAFPEAINRVQFLSRQSRDAFLGLVAACDVMLDPLHFGGGNTTYEALSLGTPIVTLPSGFMRGRVTAACYRKMGLSDCIAGSEKDYIDLAVRLGTDPEYRQSMQARILDTNNVLFDDHESLREIEEFLLAAVERARGGQAASISKFGVRISDLGTVDGGTSNPCAVALPGSSRIEAEILQIELPKDVSSNEIRCPISETESSAGAGSPSLSELLQTSTCPACGHHVAVPFYDGGLQPLATVAWPRTALEARSMKRLPLSFVRCVDCGHVYNCQFDYALVPYSEKPNLMFNKGTIWTDHLRHIRNLILSRLGDRPVVVEVGCGEGHLLRSLAECLPGGRYIGFDPSNAINTANGMIEGRRELFEPARHLAELRPDLIISRHVLEHLMNPLGFVQAISFAASWENIETRLLIEVPCIDNVIRNGRTVDFFYEHNSNFTTRSLERLLSRCASEVELVARSYNDEVLYGLARFRRRDAQVQFAREAVQFREQAVRQCESIRHDIDALSASGRRVAVWGGTGKAAAFINQYGLDAGRFPLVVDSDLEKAGTHVPGTGQEILYRSFLIQYPVAVILIATQWRAGDIVAEIERCGIACESILLEHQGRLVDYFSAEHPYRKSSKAA
jgi:predicted O-linked N-acetylglucosamine transferase (SPINDLY family)